MLTRVLRALGRRLAGRRRAEKALAESEERFRAVAESLGEGLLITDRRDLVLYANPRVAELTGYAEKEMLGRPAYELLLPPERWPAMLRRNEERMRGTAEDYEILLLRKDGTRFWAEVNATPYRDAAGEIVGTLGAITDVTERGRTQQDLRLRERALASSLNGVIITGATQQDNPIVYVNPSFERTTGYTPEETLGRNARFLQGTDKEQPEMGRLRRALREGREFFGVLRNYKKDGTLFYNEMRVSPIQDEEGRVTHFVSVQNDVTDRKTTEERLVHRAFHDPLTGLPNRARLLDRAEHAMRRAARRGAGVAVLFVDLDDLKSANDSLGHEAGDRLLVEAGERLLRSIRPTDTAARMGGDEFAVLLEDVVGEDEAVRAAERVVQELGRPMILGGQEVSVAASVGVAFGAPEEVLEGKPEGLIGKADAAMYEAKTRGKNRYASFRPGKDARSQGR